MDRSERLGAIVDVATDALMWIDAHIADLENSDLDGERKANFLERWRKRRQEILEIGARSYHARKE